MPAYSTPLPPPPPCPDCGGKATEIVWTAKNAMVGPRCATDARKLVAKLNRA